ncbi:hypothetical protein [Kutzneria kofuensis]|uniref:hypothetical protein n=1 Tax=Kutzneria kofuensis TaxID=103725 RepID=UPI003CD0A0FB
MAVSGGSQGGGLAIAAAALSGDTGFGCVTRHPVPVRLPPAIRISAEVAVHRDQRLPLAQHVDIWCRRRWKPFGTWTAPCWPGASPPPPCSAWG